MLLFRRVTLRVVLSLIAVSLFFLTIQDFLIFPGLYDSLLRGTKALPPKNIDAISLRAADGQEVVVWRMRDVTRKSKAVAVFFHGNAEHLPHNVSMQQWLLGMGIDSYAVEYRGYSGRGSGWPSEQGFYLDAESVVAYSLKEEKIDANHLVVIGRSIGTGVAAYTAQKFSAGTLVLISPYSSLTKLVSEMPVFGLLAPLLKYSFPSREYVAALQNTCVVDAHGRSDRTIPFEHSMTLKNSYHGSREYALIESLQAGHNDIMQYAQEPIKNGIEKCLNSNQL